MGADMDCDDDSPTMIQFRPPVAEREERADLTAWSMRVILEIEGAVEE